MPDNPKPRIALVVVCRAGTEEDSCTVVDLASVIDIIALPKNRATYGTEWLIVGASSVETAKRAFLAYRRGGHKFDYGKSLLSD